MATLIVILGPTGVGKTSISLRLAEKFNCPIVSSDSRQFYRELKIGTAAPSIGDLEQVKHYFIGSHSIHDEYNAGQYEEDAIRLLEELFQKHEVVLLVGGSMMYIDAICNGMDLIPTVDNETRTYWQQQFAEKGLEYIQHELKRLDEKHYNEVDLKNPKRILHALEICTITGKPYSDLRTGNRKERNFAILKIGLNRPRPELYSRINHRVDQMMAEGLLAEATPFYPFKELNTLNTVGYKELYAYMDGEYDLEKAVELIKRDSRRYAKRQMTWFNRDTEINWFHPDEEEGIIQFIDSKLPAKEHEYMKILQNISLLPYNTFGVNAHAAYFAEYSSTEELDKLLQSDSVKNNRLLHIGGGSNLLFINDFEGIVLHSLIKTIDTLEENANEVLLRVGAGVNWDDFVAYCIEHGYYGVENLSLIPGEVGASAVQNIGAYGVEVKDTIELVEAVDIKSGNKLTFSNQACEYGYRKSIFKGKLRNQVIVTYVQFRLSKRPVFQLDYAHLKEAVSRKGVFNLASVRETVIEIREEKLPNPALIGNAGSFFMNPVIPVKQFEELLLSYPTLPHYPVSEDLVKIPAGWLIEQCGLKGKKFETVGIYHKQALVIVNLGNASGADIAKVASLIQISVKKRFQIDIEPEVTYIS